MRSFPSVAGLGLACALILTACGNNAATPRVAGSGANNGAGVGTLMPDDGAGSGTIPGTGTDGGTMSPPPGSGGTAPPSSGGMPTPTTGGSTPAPPAVPSSFAPRAGNDSYNVPSTASKYSLANGCFALRSLSTGTFAARTGGGYATSASEAGGAEPLYAKPTALGEYFFYAKDGSFLSAAETGTGVGSVTTPANTVVWKVERAPDGAYGFVSASTGKALAVATDGTLMQADAKTAGAAARFAPTLTAGCTEYPEMPIGISGEPFKGQGVDKPALGFADGHTHMAMAHEMSDGSRSVGPSAGGVFYGQPVHRFGAPEALKNCEAFHGPDGVGDADLVLRMSPQMHDTKGWPDFVDWPTAASNTHQVMYHKWVERAWRSGLRLMVSLGTNINALCEVGRTATATLRPANLQADCEDMSVGTKQVQYLYTIQDYIDAQEGGPGQGWFRIVKSPAEARAVINSGRLAVVPGVEFADIFNCTVTFTPDGRETRGCDKAKIDTEIENLWKLGVRQLYPFHDVNSALGGTGIFASPALNLIGYLQTQAFWETYDCPNIPYFYGAGAVMQTAVPGTGSDPLTAAVIAAGGGTLPLYRPGQQCNARGMTDLGRYAVEKIMKKKFVIDVDHAELSIKTDMIDMAKGQRPVYPLVSMHGGHGGISMQQARDILDLGGVIFPYKPNGKGEAEFVGRVKALQSPGRLLGVGYGADANGFGGLAGPRGAGSTAVKYPFTLYSGPGWSQRFKDAGVAPVKVELLKVPQSGKSWNVDEVGTAHYGMVADFVEETRIEGGEQATDALFNSAEAYLRMWEGVENR